jgi:hypothetical protein
MSSERWTKVLVNWRRSSMVMSARRNFGIWRLKLASQTQLNKHLSKTPPTCLSLQYAARHSRVSFNKLLLAKHSQDAFTPSAHDLHHSVRISRPEHAKRTNNTAKHPPSKMFADSSENIRSQSPLPV